MTRSGDVLVVAEGAALPEEGVDEGGLAVVDVGDDGDVADLGMGTAGAGAEANRQAGNGAAGETEARCVWGENATGTLRPPAPDLARPDAAFGRGQSAPRRATAPQAPGTTRPLSLPTTMAASLKPLDQQTLVITGASSGIGLATASRPPSAAPASCSSPASRPIWRQPLSSAALRARRSKPSLPTWPTAPRLISSPSARRSGSAGSTPGSTTPGRRSMASRGTSPRRTPASSSRPTTGATVHGSLTAAGALPPEAELQPRRAHQPRLGAERPRDPAPGPLLRVQARREGLHRRPSHGGREEGDPRLHHAHQAERDQHAVPRARRQPHGQGARAPGAHLRAGGRGTRHPLGGREADPRRDRRRQGRRDGRARRHRAAPDGQADGGGVLRPAEEGPARARQRQRAPRARPRRRPHLRRRQGHVFQSSVWTQVQQRPFAALGAALVAGVAVAWAQN